MSWDLRGASTVEARLALFIGESAVLLLLLLLLPSAVVAAAAIGGLPPRIHCLAPVRIRRPRRRPLFTTAGE